MSGVTYWYRERSPHFTATERPIPFGLRKVALPELELHEAIEVIRQYEIDRGAPLSARATLILLRANYLASARRG